MRPHSWFVRMSTLAALTLASAFMGGWKWETLPH